MAWSFKKDLREVEKEYQQLIDAGWTPVSNPDGQTYSWVRGNEKYRGKNDPTPGIDAEANALDWFKRGRRQRRLMSEKVTAMLPLAYDGPGPKKKDDGTGGGGPEGDVDQAKPKTPEELMAEQKANPIQRMAVPGMPQLAPRTLQEQYGGPQTQTIRPFGGDRGRKADKEQRDEVPYFDADFEDVESPYVYATRDQIRALPIGQRFKAESLFGGRSSAEVQYEKNFGPQTPFGIDVTLMGRDYGAGDPAVKYAKKKEEYYDEKNPAKGKESYVLIRNPHYKPGSFFNDDPQGTVLGDADKALMAPSLWRLAPGVSPGLDIRDRGNLQQKTTSSDIPYSRVNYNWDEKVARALAPGAVAAGEAYAAGAALGPIIGKAGKYVKGVFSKLAPKAAKPAAQSMVPAVRTATEQAAGAATKKTTAGAMQSMADDAVVVAAEQAGAKAGAQAAKAATNATTKELSGIAAQQALPGRAAQQALPGRATRALPQSTQSNFVETTARNTFRKATGQGAPKLSPRNASSAGKKAGKGASKGKTKK